MNMQMLESRLASGEQDDSHRCGREGKGEGGEEAETFFTSFASNFFKGFPHREFSNTAQHIELTFCK